jgi:Right handed beta helix region
LEREQFGKRFSPAREQEDVFSGGLMRGRLIEGILGTLLALARQDPPPDAARITVHDVPSLRRAVAAAKSGTLILVAPGEYPGGISFSNVRGEPGRPIVVRAADPQDPPVIKGSTGIYISNPAYFELRNLTISGASVCGINIDDSDSKEAFPPRQIVLQGLKVTGTGTAGNHDGIKLSGLHDFRVEGCCIERWGTGGEGIDMVGCHDGVLEGNVFRHAGQTSATGVQMKGGTSGMTVRRNRFENVGGRGVNIGGCTGLEFFRPPLQKPPYCEAKDILVEGNLFIGANAAMAFPGVDGATVRFNTIYCPRRWALRILQENRADGFVPSRNGVIRDNLIVFRSDEWNGGGIDIGDDTAPQSFRFERNWWYCLDDPAGSRRRVKLPTEERDGVYGRDPLFRDAEKGDLSLQPGSPAEKVGAQALPQ